MTGVYLTAAQEAEADLIEEVLVPIAADLVVAVRQAGPATVQAIIDRIPEGKDRLMHLVWAAMVHPDARIKDLLDWTDTMVPPAIRERLPHGVPEPPGETERQRLIAAGVAPDEALRQAAEYLEGYAAQEAERAEVREKERLKSQRRRAAARAASGAEPTVHDRMLQVVRDGRQTA